MVEADGLAIPLSRLPPVDAEVVQAGHQVEEGREAREGFEDVPGLCKEAVLRCADTRAP